MKIAFLNIYSGINQRGAETFSHDLANRLIKKHQVIFFQAGAKQTNQKIPVKKINTKIFQPQSTFPETFLGRLRKRLFLDKANLCVLKFTLKLLPEIIGSKFDIIVPHNGFWQLLLLKIIQPFKKYKLMVIGHSGPGWDERWNLYLRPNRFVALTQAALNWAKKTCARTESVLIPLAIEKNLGKNPGKINLNLKPPIILCPAALTAYKRIDLVIKAVSRLNNVSLLILGSGKEKRKLNLMAQKLLKDRCLIRQVSHKEIGEYYQLSIIVTLPSAIQENSPMVFLEALAWGKIVVTTDTSRNRWLLESAGRYCDPGDINSYAAVLNEAIKTADDERQKKYINKALVKFSWQNVLPKYNKLINNL